jgi:hypothetical protein
MTRATTSPLSVSTGLANTFTFKIYTTFDNLEYVKVDYGDETFEYLNITGKEIYLIGKWL